MCRKQMVAEILDALQRADDATVAEAYWLLIEELEG